MRDSQRRGRRTAPDAVVIGFQATRKYQEEYRVNKRDRIIRNKSVLRLPLEFLTASTRFRGLEDEVMCGTYSCCETALQRAAGPQSNC